MLLSELKNFLLLRAKRKWDKSPVITVTNFEPPEEFLNVI
jgi:hypothetical protein